LEKKINLVAYHVPNIAVYHYAVNIYKSSPDIVNFYTLITRKNFYEKSSLESVPIQGLFPYIGENLNLNRLFPRLAFRNFYKSLHSAGNSPKQVMHYAAQYVMPLDNSLDNIVTVHDIMPLIGTSKVKPWELRFIKRAVSIYSRFEYVLVDTEYVGKQLEDYGFTGNIRVIPYPLSESFFPIENKVSLRRELGLPLEKKLVLSVSGFNSNKNIPLIKELVHILPDNYKIVRVGDAINGCINFSNIENSVLNKIYNACDVLIQPSTDEGFGGPVVEAMATKLPMVVSDIEPFHEITQGYSYFADPQQAVLFAKLIPIAIQNSENYISKAFERSKFFSFDNFKQRIRLYYSSILGQV